MDRILVLAAEVALGSPGFAAAILRRSCMVLSPLSSRMAIFEICPCTNHYKIVGHRINAVHIVQIFVDIANSLYIACKNRRFSFQSSSEAPSASRSPLDASGTLLGCPGVSWSLSQHPLERERERERERDRERERERARQRERERESERERERERERVRERERERERDI